jgi:alpha-L-fucosidase
MHIAKIPIHEYVALAKKFNPDNFDADAWVLLAHEAGMKYLVITAKHHDGFAMFKSDNPYNIADATPFKRDPMKELAEACHKHGVRLCFYYSQDLDWHAPGGSLHWE